MKICFVNPKFLIIPPPAYGAIEVLIWNYKCYLEKMGHEVVLIGAEIEDVIPAIGNRVFDIVHMCWPTYFKLFEHISCRLKLINIHTGELHTHTKCEFDIEGWKRYGCYVECLSPFVKEYFLRYGYPEDKLLLTHNGIPSSSIAFKEFPLYPARSICLATMDNRKRQYLITSFPFVDCVGPVSKYNHSKIDLTSKSYCGEWKKDDVYENLTNYANMVLLSESEADPLSVKEGLMAGLGMVLSENASQNLDRTKPFVDIIPEHKLHDSKHVESVIRANQERSVFLRSSIRKYALEHFEFQGVVNRYLENLKRVGIC